MSLTEGKFSWDDTQYSFCVYVHFRWTWTSKYIDAMPKCEIFPWLLPKIRECSWINAWCSGGDRRQEEGKKWNPDTLIMWKRHIVWSCEYYRHDWASKSMAISGYRHRNSHLPIPWPDRRTRQSYDGLIGVILYFRNRVHSSHSRCAIGCVHRPHLLTGKCHSLTHSLTRLIPDKNTFQFILFQTISSSFARLFFRVRARSFKN